jgi:hypothetical protein
MVLSDDAALQVSIDWKKVVRVSKTTTSLQVVVNPRLRRGSGIQATPEEIQEKIPTLKHQEVGTRRGHLFRASGTALLLIRGAGARRCAGKMELI